MAPLWGKVVADDLGAAHARRVLADPDHVVPAAQAAQGLGRNVVSTQEVAEGLGRLLAVLGLHQALEHEQVRGGLGLLLGVAHRHHPTEEKDLR